MRADAAAGGDRRAVDATAPPATALNVAFTFAGLRALGLAASVLDVVPRRRSARAWRRAPSGSATAGRARPTHWEAGLGTGEAHVLVTVYAVDDERLRASAATRHAARTPSGAP